MKHTPGPWRTKTGSYQDECCVETANPHQHPQSVELGVKMESRYTICYCSEPEAGQGKVNARLIAAAPELLAVVKKLVEQFRAYETGWLGSPWRARIGLTEDLYRAEAAIAKAEG